MIGIIFAVVLSQLPSSVLTPGANDPSVLMNVPLKTLCTVGYTSTVRNVPEALKREVFKEYGVNPRIGGPYEVDHLCSLELGCNNSLKNLWPESYVTVPWNAHKKDQLENKLHSLVRSGKLPLSEAQKEISTDWISAYERYIR